MDYENALDTAIGRLHDEAAIAPLLISSGAKVITRMRSGANPMAQSKT